MQSQNERRDSFDARVVLTTVMVVTMMRCTVVGWCLGVRRSAPPWPEQGQLSVGLGHGVVVTVEEGSLLLFFLPFGSGKFFD